jgi:hypothetical protein
MIAEIKGNELVIRIPLQAPAPSASGKTLVVATTRGNVKTAAQIEGKPITIGLNAYIAK